LRAALAQLEEAELLFCSGMPPDARYTFKHALVQDTAYETLLRSRRQILHRQIADALRGEFPTIAAAEPELVAHHLTQAGLDEPAIEWWGKAGDQALRRSAFKEAAAHLGKAVELADKLAATAPRAATGINRLHSQISLGNALMWAKGLTAPETSAAFGRARELASRVEDASERFSAYHGLWMGHITRGEPAPMREMAQLFLREATARPDCPEALVAHRISGTTCVYFGDLADAHEHLHKAIELYDPARHGDFANRFGQDPRPAAEVFDAIALWLLGRVDEALCLADRAVADAKSAAHAPTMAHALAWAALLGLLRYDPEAVATYSQALADIVSRYDLPAFMSGFAVFFQGWAKWLRGEGEAEIPNMRRGIAIDRETGLAAWLNANEVALAEAEASAGETDAGLRRLDDTLAVLEHTEERWYEAEMHRIRAEILLKRDPADTAGAEQSLQTAIAIAQSQKARSFELRATLSLAKLYRAANRDADAHAVLAPAVEGFPPTQQFPEFTEAQALLAALSESDAVKNATALSQRRVQLQTSLGNALIWAKGYGAPETSAAFARARELSSREEDASQRFSAYYGLWVGHLNRCEPAPMREMAEIFLREATARPDCPEALIAHRIAGLTCLYFGDYAAAHDHFRKTVELYDQARHGDFANRFGQDSRAAAEAFDAIALWVLGRVDEALLLSDRALADAESAAHAPTMAHTLAFAARLGLLQDSSEAVATSSQALADIVSRYDLPAHFVGLAVFFQGWAKSSDAAEESRRAEMQRGLSISREQGHLLWLSAAEAALAIVEASAGEIGAALRRLDDALAELEHTEERWYEPEMHRIRGEILLKRDPANTAAAEQSLQAAIAIAQSQKARSFELRAALSLAKLYRTADRDADAHAVLAPAVEDFPPTQQFHELTDAQVLLAALSENDAVKSAAALRQRRVHLQISLGNALIWAKGQQAPETSAAFARARELASRVEDPSQRFSAYWGLWVGHLTRGEPASLREMAELFLREATAQPNCPEAVMAHRISATTCLYFGDFVGVHDNCQTTIELYDPARHGDFANRFGSDPRANAESIDALTLWVLGRIDEALPLADRALADAAAHAPTMAIALTWAAVRGLWWCNPEAVATYSQALADIVSRYGLPTYWAGFAVFFQGWANRSDAGEESRLAEMRRGVAINREQGYVWFLPSLEAALAEAEAGAGETGAGLRRLDDALAEVERTEHRAPEAEMHRIRGEILLKRDPANTAAAEQSLQAAIAIAQSQKARSFELRAALSLAKLYRAANRDADAHAVLTPAVEGFPPTRQFPELTEAQTLLAALNP
jgi:predicted ATPase